MTKHKKNRVAAPTTNPAYSKSQKNLYNLRKVNFQQYFFKLNNPAPLFKSIIGGTDND